MSANAIRVPTVVVASVLLVAVTATHAAEDIEYNEFGRLGVNAICVGLVLGAVYAAQVYGAFLAGRDSRAGAVILGIAGFVWCAGAIVIHGPEILAIAPYRHGLISRGLVAAVIALGAFTAWIGAVDSSRRPPRPLL